MGFSSVPRLPGWSFLQLICGGVLPLFPLPAGFPPLISCEKTAPSHQSLHKSPPSFLGWQEMSGFSKASRYLYFSVKYTPIVKKGIKKSWYSLRVLEQVISRVLFPVLVTLYGTMVIHLFPLLLMG